MDPHKHKLACDLKCAAKMQNLSLHYLCLKADLNQR